MANGGYFCILVLLFSLSGERTALAQRPKAYFERLDPVSGKVLETVETPELPRKKKPRRLARKLPTSLKSHAKEISVTPEKPQEPEQTQPPLEIDTTPPTAPAPLEMATEKVAQAAPISHPKKTTPSTWVARIGGELAPVSLYTNASLTSVIGNGLFFPGGRLTAGANLAVLFPFGWDNFLLGPKVRVLHDVAPISGGSASLTLLEAHASAQWFVLNESAFDGFYIGLDAGGGLNLLNVSPNDGTINLAPRTEITGGGGPTLGYVWRFFGNLGAFAELGAMSRIGITAIGFSEHVSVTLGILY